MKNFSKAVRDILLFPERLIGYSIIMHAVDEFINTKNEENDLSAGQPVSSLYPLLLNTLFVLVLGITFFFSGFSITKAVVLALTLLAASLLAGSMHLSVGLTLLLFGVFLATQNIAFATTPEPTLKYWWIGLPSLFAFPGIYAQWLSHPKFSTFKRIWKVLFGICLTSISLYVVYYSANKFSVANISFCVLLLSYTLAAPTKEAKTLVNKDRTYYELHHDSISIFSSVVYVLAGIIITWQWCIAWVQNFSVLAKILLFPLSIVVGIGILLATLYLPMYLQEEVYSYEDKNPFYDAAKRWLLLVFFLSLQIVFDPLTAFQASIIGVILVGISFISLNRLQENTPVILRAATYAIGGVIWLYIISGYILDDTWLKLGWSLLTPTTVLPLYWVIFCATVLSFSIIRPYWATSLISFILVSLMWVVDVVVRSSSMNIFLVFLALFSGMLVGITGILIWPFLSLVTYAAFINIKKHKTSVEEIHSALALVEIPILLRPLWRSVLLRELFNKGLQETELRAKSSKRLLNKIKEQLSRSYFQSEFKIADLADKEILGMSPSLQEIVGMLREGSKQDVPSFEMARIYSKALDKLTKNMKRYTSGFPRSLLIDTQEKEIAYKLEKQILTELEPIAIQFNVAYEHFEEQIQLSTIKVIHIEISDYDQKARRVIEEAIDRNLKATIALIDSAIIPDEELPLWPREDKSTLISLNEIRVSLNSINSIRYDFPAERRTVQPLLDALVKKSTSIEKDYLMLRYSAEKSEIVTLENPWFKIVALVSQLLGEILYLLNLEVEWARKYLVKVISKIDTLDKIGKIDKLLDSLSGFSEKYDPIIDETILRLEAVGREASSALAFPEGYSRRIGLQDAFDRLSELRSLLSVRFLVESKEILEQLNRLSEMLHGVLYISSDEKSIGFRNPYQAGNPIQESRSVLFKGRKELLQKMVVILRSRSTPTFILHGPRRMGKTSFLLQLPRLLPQKFIPAYIDMQAGLAQTDGQFFYSLADAIFRQVGRKLELEKPNSSAFNKNPYLTFTQWLDKLKPKIEGYTLFFTIDEFETIGKRISEGVLTIQVLEHLRHLMQHNENIIFLFAGVQTLEALGPNSASYFIGAYPLEISYLSTKEAEELIRNPDPSAGNMPQYNKDVIVEILRMTKCQPYLIQAVCSEIIGIAIEKSISRITKPVLEGAVKRVLSGIGTNYFKYIWDDSQKAGQDLLLKIIADPTVKLTSEKIKVLNKLIDRHIVQKLEDQSYIVEIPLVEMWIRSQYLK